jgi:nitroreductase
MDVISAIKKRYSVRSYEEREIEQDKLEKVLEAGRLAPSGMNLQDWRFVVVRDQTLRQKLAEASNNQQFVAQAPVVIVACGVDTDRIALCGHPVYLLDVAIAVDHMTLKAVEEGLGTCWIGAFYEEKVKEILDIPKDVRVVTLLTLGYPKGRAPKKKDRKNLSEIVMHNKWA